MFAVYYKKTAPKIRAFVAEFRKDQSGVAAIEFAYMLPILILMLFGMVEMGRAIQLDRKFDMVTAMTSDMVARQEQFGTSEAERDEIIERMTDAVDHLMLPYDPDRLRLAIIPVARPLDENEDPYIYAGPFIHNEHPTNLSQCENVTNGADLGASDFEVTNLVPPGGRIIIVTSQYDFQPLFAKPFTELPFGIKPTQFFDTNDEGISTWTNYSVHSPRHNCNDFDNNNCQVTCSGS